VGWWLVGSGLLVFCVGFIVWAAGTRDDAQFNRAVGWATISALPVGCLGLAVLAFDKWRAARQVPSMQAVQDAEDRLAELVLKRETTQRARLLGTNQEDTQAISVGFYREMVRYRPAGGGAHGQLDTVLDYYESLDPGRFVILGKPGSGKTVLAVHLLVRILERRQAGHPRPDGQPWAVPVRFSLAAYDTTLTLDQWITGQLEQRFTDLPEAVARELVDRRRILPVLDGLDEMDPDQGTPQRAIAAVDRINTYVRGTGPSPVVVTCRLDRYKQLIGIGTTPAPATDVYIEELDVAQVSAYLHAQLRGPTDEAAWGPILTYLDDDPDSAITRAFIRAVSSPWRLTLAVTVCRSGTNPADLLTAATVAPSTADARQADPVLSMLLDRFIPAATRLHPDSRYTDPAKVTRWLTTLADHLRWQAAHGRSGTDLLLVDLWQVTHDNRARAWHTTFAFTAYLTAVIVVGWTQVGSRNAWITNVRYFLDNFPHLSPARLVVGLAVVFAFTVMPWWCLFEARSESPAPSELNLGRLRTPHGRGQLAGWLAIGLADGLAGWLRFGLGLALGLAAGLAFGLAAGLEAGLNTGLSTAVRPVDPLRNSIAAGLADGLPVGLAVGLASGLAFRLTVGLASGLASGLAFGLLLARGGPLAVRYGIGVALASFRRDLPRRPSMFLAWACDAGLMRVSGIAYQFRHQQLRDWLAPDEHAPLLSTTSASPSTQPHAAR